MAPIARRTCRRAARSVAAALTDRNCTAGGIVGASVIATRRRPRSQVIVQSPRSAFSTRSNPDPAAHAPTCARRRSIAARRRSLLSIEKEVDRRDAIGSGVVPLHDETGDGVARRDERGRRLRRRAAAAPPVRASASSAASNGARPARVGPVAERDDPDAVLRQPAHQRAEARQAAAVRDDRRELAGLRDPQPVAVAAGVQLDAAAASSTRDAGAGATTCCISRSEARRIGAVSGPSRGGHAARNAPT